MSYVTIYATYICNNDANSQANSQLRPNVNTAKCVEEKYHIYDNLHCEEKLHIDDKTVDNTLPYSYKNENFHKKIKVIY